MLRQQHINGNQEFSCPDHVFELPVSEKFTPNAETYDLSEVLSVSVNTIELHINNQLSEHLKSDNIRIYGSNLTSLDSSFERLSRLTNTIVREIKTIDSPISNRLFDAIKVPMGWISLFFNRFSAIIAIVLSIAAAILLLPIIVIGVMLWRVSYKIAATIIACAMWLTDRCRPVRRRHTTSRRLRSYLTKTKVNFVGGTTAVGGDE